LNKGFTLIELLVASFVILLFSTYLYYLTNVSFNSIKVSNDYYAALLEVSNIMEDMKRTSFSELPNYDGSGFGNDKGAIYVEPMGPDLYGIRIEYSWQAGRKPIKMFTMQSRY